MKSARRSGSPPVAVRSTGDILPIWDPTLAGERLAVGSLGLLVPSTSLAAKKLRLIPGGVEWLHGVFAERGSIDLGYELRSGSEDWYEISCVALVDRTIVQCTLMRNRTSGLVLELVDMHPQREDEDVFATRFFLRLHYRELELVRRWNGWVEEFTAFKARHQAFTHPVVTSALRFVEHQRSSIEERSRRASRSFVLEALWQRCGGCGQDVEGATSCSRCGASLLDAPFVRLQLRIEGRLDSELWTDAEEVVISGDGRRELTGLQVEAVGRGRLLLTCHLLSDPPEEGQVRPAPSTAVYDQQRQACVQLKAGSPRTGLVALNVVRPGLVQGSSRSGPAGSGRLNAEQRDVVSRAGQMRPGQVLLVQGPPGTGKTTAIVEAISGILAQRPEARILFASHSNEAVDAGQERLLSVPGVRQLRIASPGKVTPALHDTLSDGGSLEAHNLVAGTVNRLVIDERVRGTRFDYLILDEANKVLIAEALALLPLGARWILVGDPNQLPPILDEGADAFAVQTDEDRLQIQDSFYGWFWRQVPDGARAFLPRQYRMVEPIGALVSDTFYDGGLVNEAPDACPVLPAPLDRAIVWIDTGLRSERRGSRMSLSNEFEVALCRELAAGARGQDPGASLAVIAMYTDQVRRLQAELAELVDPHDIESVDAFEGREADLVVLSLVRSNQRGQTGFIEDPRRVNVAVSRAKRQLVIVGDSSTVARAPDSLFQRIFRRCVERGLVVQAKELAAAWDVPVPFSSLPDTEPA